MRGFSDMSRATAIISQIIAIISPRCGLPD